MNCSGSFAISSSRPWEVAYAPHTGIDEGDVMIGDPLANGGEAAVNAANGNLFVTSPDVDYQGEGYETKLTRYYDSEDENLAGDSFGQGWFLGMGNDTLLYPNWWDRSYTFHEAGGGWSRFDPSPPASSAQEEDDLTYTAPALNATLVAHENGTRTLTFNETGAEWQFDNSENGFPQQIFAPRTRNSISLGYTESLLTHVSDTHSHELTISHDSVTHHVTKVTSASGEHWEYTYNSNHQLISYKNSEGHESKYGYSSTTGQLDEITDASGTYVVIKNAEERVASLRRLVNGTTKEVGSEDEIYSYEYKAPASPTCNPSTDVGETVITQEPGGSTETYCFDGNDHFTGPLTESEQEGEEPLEELAAGTCYEDPELHKTDCEDEEELPEEVEDRRRATTASRTTTH